MGSLDESQLEMVWLEIGVLGSRPLLKNLISALEAFLLSQPQTAPDSGFFI